MYQNMSTLSELRHKQINLQQQILELKSDMEIFNVISRDIIFVTVNVRYRLFLSFRNVWARKWWSVCNSFPSRFGANELQSNLMRCSPMRLIPSSCCLLRCFLIKSVQILLFRPWWIRYHPIWSISRQT